MKVTVCIGSSCHIKGSRRVVEQLQLLVAENDLSDKVELGGTFCMGQCQKSSFSSLLPKTTSATRWSWEAPSVWDSAKRAFALPLTIPSIRYLPKT